MNGFYGIGSVDLEYQAAEMLIRDPAENLPTNPAGIYGKTHAPRPLVGAVSFISGLWVMNNKNKQSKLVGLPLIGLDYTNRYFFTMRWLVVRNTSRFLAGLFGGIFVGLIIGRIE